MKIDFNLYDIFRLFDKNAKGFLSGVEL